MRNSAVDNLSDTASQWISLLDLLKAVAVVHGQSLDDARQVLRDCPIYNLRPLLVERSGIHVVVSDLHDHTFDNAICASLSKNHDEFRDSDISAAAYCDFHFTIESIVYFVKQKGINVDPQAMKDWQVWIALAAPALRAQGLLYESNVSNNSDRFKSIPALMSMDEAASHIGIGRTLFNERVRPHVEIVDLGHRSKRVTRESLERFIKGIRPNEKLQRIVHNQEHSEWERKNKYRKPEVTRAKGLSGATTHGTSTSELADVEFERALARLTEKSPKDA